MEIDKTRDELLIALKEHLDPRKHYSFKVLKALAVEKEVPVKKTVDKIVEGWAGKPMGLYHELWLLGHIPEVDGKIPKPRTSRFTKNGKKGDRDADGNLTEEGKKYCLLYLRSQCSDFKNEKSAIECILYQISQNKQSWYTCRFSPKYHYEIAGEGIEYAWELIKRMF